MMSLPLEKLRSRRWKSQPEAHLAMSVIAVGEAHRLAVARLPASTLVGGAPREEVDESREM